MKILIIGATSAIAKATARIYAERKHELFLIARNEARLNDLAADLDVRGAQMVLYPIKPRVRSISNSQKKKLTPMALASFHFSLSCRKSLRLRAAAPLPLSPP